MSAVPAVVISAPGTNRDHETAFALQRAGADPQVIALATLAAQPQLLDDARLIAVAGGFSYGDALGSGRLFALELLAAIGDRLQVHVAAGRPLIGICNGFQMLVRAGLLTAPGEVVMLDANASGTFECRWVTMDAPPSRCIWTAGIDEPLLSPIAHGEGRFRADAATLESLRSSGRIALRYGSGAGGPADGVHPGNPNGSDDDIAGICDPTGLVLGLMPHPEDHITARQHPGRARGETDGNCLVLFHNGVDHARQL